jgi:hypothetical protein
MRKWRRIIKRRQHEALDARITEARERATQAAEEAERSRRRQEAVHRTVVTPLREAAEHNRFAELVRESIIEGHHRRTA